MTTDPIVVDGLEVERVRVDSLKLFPGNARRGDVPAIVASLKAHGQFRALVCNDRAGAREVLIGNNTLRALRRLKRKHVDVSWLDVGPVQASEINAIDNRTSDLASYDTAALLAQLRALPDLARAGYHAGDLAALAGTSGEPVALTDRDDAAPLPAEKPRSKVGDVYELGPSVLLVGDATDTDAVLAALGDARADCVWTDPPYGVDYVGKTKDALTIQNDGAAGLGALLADSMRTAVAASRPGAPVYVAHAETERDQFTAALRLAGIQLRQTLVWVKNAMVLGRSDYHYKHEPILEAVAPVDVGDDDGDGRTYEPVAYGFTEGGVGRLGRGGPRWHGDHRATTVFDIPRPSRSAEHPTMKPVELIDRMLVNSLPEGGLVLDLFGGSGSTLIAAHHRRSRAFLVELDPRYADAICLRWQRHTGQRPVLRRTGEAVDFDG